MKPLSVLFVTPFLPSPPVFGGQRRLHGLMTGVAAAGNNVSVLSLVDPSETHAEAIRATLGYAKQVVTVPNRVHGRVHKRLNQLKSMATTHSYEYHGHDEPDLRSALARMLAAEHFDVVQFELAHMASYARVCGPPFVLRPVLCLDEHNIEYDLVRRTAEMTTDPVRRAYSALEWRKIRREEREAWQLVDGCTLTSERDQRLLLADEPGTRTAVVPNGVDLDFFNPATQAQSDLAPTLLFFGAIDYYPNTDAVLHLVRDVLPSLVGRHPGLRLQVVGRRPPKEVLALRSNYVDVVGEVDDVRPWIDRATAVVVPLRIGGGTRLKILESMAMGKAIVSTPLGAEGLATTPEHDILIGDDPARFTVQVDRLLYDPDLRKRTGAAARQLVEARYSWRSSVDNLLGFYNKLMARRRAAEERVQSRSTAW